MAILVEYSERLQTAVDQVMAPLAMREGSQDARSGRSTFTDRKGAYTEGGGEYNGMFKCEITANKEGTTVVVIYNGSDELDITDINSFQKQWAGQCYVNNKSQSVQNYYKEYTGNVPDTKWLLKFEHDPSKRLNVTIVEYTDGYSKPLPDGTSTTAWYLLAETKNGRLIQQHNSGAPQLFWFSNCNEMDTEDA